MKRSVVEPKIVTGLWLAKQMNRYWDRAEFSGRMALCDSDGKLLPGCKKWKTYMDLCIKNATECANRLKMLVEPKIREEGGEQDGCRTRKDRRGLARLGGRLMTTPCRHPKQR
jgi:hypothetical protein